MIKRRRNKGAEVKRSIEAKKTSMVHIVKVSNVKSTMEIRKQKWKCSRRGRDQKAEKTRAMDSFA